MGETVVSLGVIKEFDGASSKKKRNKRNDIQPVYLEVVSALENKLVNDAVDGHGAADQLQLSIGGVTEDEVRAVEARQGLPAYTSCELFCRRELSAIQASWRREKDVLWLIIIIIDLCNIPQARD